MQKGDILLRKFLPVGTADRKFHPGVQHQSMVGLLVDVVQIDNEAMVAAAECATQKAGKQIPEAQVDGDGFSRQVDGGLVIDRLRIEDILGRYFARTAVDGQRDLFETVVFPQIPVNGLRQLFLVHRLHEIVQRAGGKGIRHVFLIRGNVDDRTANIAFPQACGQFHAVFLGQPNVQQKQMEGRTLFLQG